MMNTHSWNRRGFLKATLLAAAAPAIVKFVGGDVPFALRATRTVDFATVAGGVYTIAPAR